MLALHSLFEFDPDSVKHLKQAAIWGAGSIMGTRLAQDKDKRKKLLPGEKKKETKKTFIQGLVGATAGAAGSKFS